MRRADQASVDEREIDRVLDELSREDAVDVIRAFGLYFQMVTLAEEVYREFALADGGGGYMGPEQFDADLGLIESSVMVKSGRDVARPIRLLRRSVELFGFHLVSLEWRRHRDCVIEALDEVVAAVEPQLPPLSARSVAERDAWFARELHRGPAIFPRTSTLGAKSADIIAPLDAVRTLRALRGQAAVSSPILAGTEGPDEILALLVLARACGTLENGPLQIVPLLESDSALRNGADIAACLLAQSGFRAHVGACGDVWEVMLGYSDSAKVSGIAIFAVTQPAGVHGGRCRTRTFADPTRDETRFPGFQHTAAQRRAGARDCRYADLRALRARTRWRSRRSLELRLAYSRRVRSLARSIALRNPYVDTLSLMQIRLLRAYRASDERDIHLSNAIRLSISGITAGLRVTG